MRTPNLNTLRMFDAAARHLNFRLAAEELGLTQGAVAQQVRRLEADFGLKLFHRKARGLSLTEAGRGYGAQIRRAMAIIEAATQALPEENQTIVLSVPPSVASKWLVPNLASFSQMHPEIEVQILATESLSTFKSDHVDLAIRLGRPPFGDDLDAALFSAHRLCAVCSRDYADEYGKTVTGADLKKHCLLYDSHNHWQDMLDQAGLNEPEHSLRFNQTALAMDAAVNGQGVALVPFLLAKTDIEKGRLVKVWEEDEDSRYGFYIVSPGAGELRAPVLAMKNWLLSVVRS